ncbi:hypothetical protein AB205_0089490 [Aquarana catesbeiana]|uniref:Uncharacterized protein n=1 Tax=Aquarana catesbeiana TaxID=8400 RepID=A0A2G9RPH7_AQUCT|nr:hypothetical protein AB205_0089490 [Aquarana catesbeiana]
MFNLNTKIIPSYNTSNVLFLLGRDGVDGSAEDILCGQLYLDACILRCACFIHQPLQTTGKIKKPTTKAGNEISGGIWNIQIAINRYMFYTY